MNANNIETFKKIQAAVFAFAKGWKCFRGSFFLFDAVEWEIFAEREKLENEVFVNRSDANY